MKLEELRRDLIWSQAELARRAGIAAVTVSKAERGEPINGRSALLICKALSTALNRNVTPKELNLNVTV